MEQDTVKVKVKKIKLPSTLVTSILWIILGVILLVYPGQSLDMICRVLGVIAIVFGIIQIVLALIGGGPSSGFGVAVGIILGIVGIVIIVNPDLLVSLLPTVIGVVLVVHGVISLINSFRLIRYKDKFWWLALIFSILSIGMGALLFFRARDAAEYVARIGGFFMIYSGIMHLWLLYRLKKTIKVRTQEATAIDVDAQIVDE